MHCVLKPQDAIWERVSHGAESLMRTLILPYSIFIQSGNLTRSQVTKYRITFVRTKGKKNRSIPISKELYDEIIALDGFKFFTDFYFQFLSVMDKTSIVLPRGQLTHILRHTFAAHFMMSGGNILALQKILGHHDIKMTMRYDHLAPDHLETALRFNPLATMGQSSLGAVHVRA